MLILSCWPTLQYDNLILLDATENHTNEVFQNFVWGFKKIETSILRVDNATSSILASKRILAFYLLKKNINIVIHFPIVYKSIKKVINCFKKKSYKLL